MKKNYSFLLLGLLLFLSSCIEPITLNIENEPKHLVVDGEITNEPGPITIKVSLSTPYASYTGELSSLVRKATVIISNDKGQRETLVENKPGIYTTSGQGLQGQIGHTYTLTIKTKEGKQYSSTPELLAPVPEITNLYTEVKEQKILNASGNEETVYNLGVYVDTSDPAESKNYYLWQWEGIYRVSTQPWDYKEKVRGVLVSKPKPCCQVCWVTEITDRVNVQNDRLVNGKELKRHLITQIPINERTFESKYHLEVKQASISEAAYDYWNMLKTQTANVGNIQDPPPATIKGNISNINDPNEIALGYFGASAVTKKTIEIKREDLGLKLGELIFPDDCRVLSRSTTEKPVFW